jgi:SNF family Na+-dependent transporter
MIIYSGHGYLVLVLFILPLIVIGAILNWGFGIDVLRTTSSLPLHSLMVTGAILIFVVGRYLNQQMVEETVYEESARVKIFRPRHTLYYLRMEYWAPITLAVYFAFVAYRAFK